jgi:hypothetical protein
LHETLLNSGCAARIARSILPGPSNSGASSTYAPQPTTSSNARPITVPRSTTKRCRRLGPSCRSGAASASPCTRHSSSWRPARLHPTSSHQRGGDRRHQRAKPPPSRFLQRRGAEARHGAVPSARCGPAAECGERRCRARGPTTSVSAAESCDAAVPARSWPDTTARFATAGGAAGQSGIARCDAG